MNIACTSCPAKYGVPDEKVRGRKVRITCKRCGAAIIVDGTQVAPAAATLPQAPLPAAGDRVRQRTILGGLEAPVDSAPGARRSEPPPADGGAPATPAAAIPAAAVPKAQVAFPRPGGSAAQTAAAAKTAVAVPKAQVAAPAAQAKAAPAASAPAARPVEAPWTVAVTDEDHRDMHTAEVVEAYAARTIDAETFIWRDGMEDWLTPFEIPAIGSALKARGLTPRVNAESESTEVDPPRAPQSSGSWHEPGKWDQRLGDPAFDDVTVAMAAPKAQQLLDAVTTSADAARAKAANEEPKAARPAPRPAAGTPPPEEAPPPASPAAATPLAVASPTAKPATTGAAAGRPAPPREEKRDLFARAPKEPEEDAPRARMASIPPEPHAQASLTGVRHESSVLFSLDQLTGGAAKTKSAAAKQAKVEKVEAEALMFGSGGSTSNDAPPSVANLGGGAFFNPATMAAPDFTAAAVPSTPLHTRPSSAPPTARSSKKSGGGIWIALALIVVAGGGAAFLFLRPAPQSVAVAPEGTARVATPPDVPAPPVAPVVASAAPVDTAAAAASAPAAVGSEVAPAPSASASSASSATAVPPPAAGTPAAVGAHPSVPPAAAPSPGTATHPETPKPATPAAAATPTPKPEAPAASAEGPEFDRAAAASALAAAASSAQGECASLDGPHGTGKVTITFMNSGRATNALVSGDFAGSALGGCVARVFRGAKVPPFAGDSVRVNKTVHIP